MERNFRRRHGIQNSIGDKHVRQYMHKLEHDTKRLQRIIVFMCPSFDGVQQCIRILSLMSLLPIYERKLETISAHTPKCISKLSKTKQRLTLN